MTEQELIERTRTLIGRFDNMRIVGVGWAGNAREGFEFNPLPTGGGEGVAPPTGACCMGVDCSITTEVFCNLSGGLYQGDDTLCFPNPCGGGECPNLKIIVHQSGDGTSLQDSQVCGAGPDTISYFGNSDLCFDVTDCFLDTGVMDVPMFACNSVVPPPIVGTLRFLFTLIGTNLTTEIFWTNDDESVCCSYSYHRIRNDTCTSPGCEFIEETDFGTGPVAFTFSVTYDDACP